MSKVATPAGLGTTMKAGTGRRVKAGPGITVSAGPGFRQGLWYTLSTKDGVKYFNSNLMQDLAGDWWFSDGFMGPGVSRYDGANLTRFTTADGLGSNAISAVFKDRQGHLWFATEGGVSRYDGVHFTTFTTADGLVHDSVRAIIEDRQGHLWFATQGGVSRYDGVHFTTFTTADGLVHNTVRVMLADSQGNLWFGNGGRHRTDGRLPAI